MPCINNVTRFLDARKVNYTARELPAEKLGARETAQILGVPLGKVFKTIVALREKKKPALAVIPGGRMVDLKALAAFLREKKISLPTEREAEALTGLQAGGISPLALTHKGFAVVLDAEAQSYEHILISGGQRGLNIELATADLIQITAAQVAPISRAED